MARYRKIDTRIWNDQKFNSVNQRLKLTMCQPVSHFCHADLHW